MNKKALTVVRKQLGWIIIIVGILFGTIAIIIYLKYYTSNWLPLK